MRKKILILINSDIYTRNYLETNAFDKLIKNFDCYFVASSGDVFNKKKLTRAIKKNFIGYINYSEFELRKFQKCLYKNFLLNKEKSKTISYLKKIILRPKLYWQGEKWYESLYRSPKRLISWLKKNIEYLIIKNFDKKVFVKKPNLNMVRICEKIKPDLVIYPLQDAHLASFDLLQINKKNKTLGLIDNWDNLSSRPTHQLKPKYITVWGKQTKQHAVKFQKYNANNTFVIGTPRFNDYFKKRNINIKSNFKFKYILFLESFNNFDNFSILKKLDNLIDSNKKFKNYKILYRPHPWQKKNSITIWEKQFKNLILDPQLKKNYLSKNFSTSIQPNIDYYSSLIKNSEIVITGPTSMLIEASIFYKKILLLGYKNKSSTPYSEELKNFEHLEGIKKFSNIRIVVEESNLINDLLDTYNIKVNKKKIDRIRNYYLNYSGFSYKDMLFSVTKKIIYD